MRCSIDLPRMAVSTKQTQWALLAQFLVVSKGQYQLTNLVLPSVIIFLVSSLTVLRASFLLAALLHLLLVSLAETKTKLWNGKKKTRFLESSRHHRNRHSSFMFTKTSPYFSCYKELNFRSNKCTQQAQSLSISTCTVELNDLLKMCC